MDGWDELGGADVTETPEVYDEMVDSALEAIEPVEVPETMDMPEPVESSFEFSDAAPEMPEESYVDSVMDSVEPEALEFEDEIPEAEPQFEEMPIEEPQIDEPAIEEPQIEEQIEVFDPEPQPEMVSEVAETEPEVMDVAPEVTEPAPQEAQIQEWAEGETVEIDHEEAPQEWAEDQMVEIEHDDTPQETSETLDDNFEIPEPQPEEIEQSYVDSVMDSVEPEDLDFEDEIPETPEVQEIPEEAQIEESDIEVFDPEPQPETVQEVMDEAPEEVQEPQEWTEGETIEIEHEEVPETEVYTEDVKVLKRDETELWQEGNEAIQNTLEAMRDDLRDKGWEDGPEMEAMIMHEQQLMQQELANNIQGDFSEHYDGPAWQKTDLEGTSLGENALEENTLEETGLDEIRPIDKLDDWLEDINPNFDPFDLKSPYANNCGSCAYAVYQRLEGNNEICATEQNIGYNSEMEALTGMEQVSMSPEDIQTRLLEQGDGAHAIIGIDRAVGPGHWFNAANIGGKVVAIDGQSGEILDWPPDYGDVTNWEMSIKKETNDL